MKYFTPELFTLSNSRNLEEALASSDEWEKARDSYRRRLRSLRPKLPEGVNRFLDAADLHDAEYLGETHYSLSCSVARSIANPTFAHVFVRRHELVTVLNYLHTSDPTVKHDQLPMRLRTTPTTWLYDEFDVVGESTYSHEVLLSDGRLIKLLFSHFQFSSLEFLSAGPHDPRSGGVGERLLPV